MAKRRIIWPFAGRADEQAHAEQPELTTRQARNVRIRDPVTGRIRGGSRSGLVEFNPDAIGATRAKALVSTAVDTRKVEFSYTAGQEVVEWMTETPSKTDVAGMVTDPDGNLYALDGQAGIVKYNSAKRELVKIAVPVADPGHVVRALHVDTAFRVYAGVSSGGDVATARVFCFLQLEANSYHLLWQITPGAYTESLRVHREVELFAAHNYPLERRSRVVIYREIGLLPEEARRIESTAYPINQMDLGPDGSVYTATPADDPAPTGVSYAIRRGHPSSSPGSVHAPIVGWKPTDDSSLKIWSWFDAEDIKSEDVLDANLVDGQEVLIWRDKSGNGRHLYAGTADISAEKGPLYRTSGIGGRPCVLFDNRTTEGGATIKHSLVSGSNASVEKTLAAQQRSMIPTYKDALWCLFMVIRPTEDDDAVTPSPRVVLSMDNQASSGSDHHLFVNRNAEILRPGTYVQGRISYFAETDNTGDAGQSGTVPPHSNEFDFTSFGSPDCDGAILVTILWDGGVQPNDTSKTRCIVRYNGRPIDRFEGLPLESLAPTWLGLAPDPETFVGGEDVARRFRGEIAEILVLDRRDRFDNTEPKVLTFDAQETGDPDAAQTDTQMARIEAYLAYKWGIGRCLRDNMGSESIGNFTHFYARLVTVGPNPDIELGGPPKPGVGGLDPAHQHILSRWAMTVKHDAQGVLKWVANWYTHSSGATEHGGFGYGVVVRKLESDEKTYVWTIGFQPAVTVSDSNQDLSESTEDVRKLVDNGDTFSGASADGAWTHERSASAQQTYTYPRMAADKFGVLWVPFDTDQPPADDVVGFNLAPDGSGQATVLSTLSFVEGNSPRAVALPPDALVPDYRGDLATELADVVYTASTKGAPPFGDLETVRKYRVVQTNALTTGNPREVVTLAVVEDDIRIVTESTNVVPTGGLAAIDGTAQFIQALRAGEDIVVLDGMTYKAYNLRTGEVETLVSTSAGEIPPRGRYAMFWRHRLVLALDGGKYAASRLGNIRDWNLNPGTTLTGVPLQTATQAFTGTIVRAGEAEDSLVTLIPGVDDLAWLVGESKILRLTGDPQSGGEIHLLTDSMGGVFGDSWCKDTRGRVFMWGNKPPGLYYLPPNGDPQPLTERSLESTDFETEIDYATHRIVLAWDPIEHGVRIFQVAWQTDAIVAHWFWEERAHRAVRQPPVWQDRYNSVSLQPTAVAYLGGDDTRGLIIGCADGKIRRFDANARDDAGTAIDSFVLFELTAGLPEGRAYRVRELSLVIASDQEEVWAELFASETADAIGAIVAQTFLKPGRNRWRARAKGAHLWLRLRKANVGRWAFEEGTVDLEEAGIARLRAV